MYLHVIPICSFVRRKIYNTDIKKDGVSSERSANALKEQQEERIKKLKSKTGKFKGKNLFSLITKITVVAAIIASMISIIVTYSNHSDMQEQLDSIHQKTQELEAENVELRRILEDDDIDAYMEKLAIEKMNYAYPDERRYYDKSRN